MSRAFKIIKGIITLIFTLVVLSVVSVLAWRMLSSGDPRSVRTISPTREVVSAYAEHGEELYMFRQEQRSITSGEDNYSYFAITNAVIIPEANQIQTVLRYNNSTLKHTAEDLGLDSVPSREDDVYDVTLLLALDLTPENEEDNSGNDPESVKFVRCHGTLETSDVKNMYNYRRMSFSLDDAGLDLAELIDEGLLLAIYTDIYYCDAVDYDSEPYGVLCIYDFKSANIRVELERRDIEALEDYSE